MRTRHASHDQTATMAPAGAAGTRADRPAETRTSTRRLIIVSNRMPFTITAAEDGITMTEATGGLVTGLRSYIAAQSGTFSEIVWVGWPGTTIRPEFQDAVREQARTTSSGLPVFLDAESMDLFYHGFCNKTLWPLFHYFPVYAAYEDAFWESYTAVNRLFCDTLAAELRPGDVVWVHDYHLMLLPQMLREHDPDLTIGFFLHIPFPTFELFRLIPARWRKAILEGILGADLVGFHTYDYCQHFLQSVLRILGHEHQMGRLILPSHVVHVRSFPMGIDFAAFVQSAATPEVRAEADRMRQEVGDRRIILSVDRLDYSKGILNRLLAFEQLLDLMPDARGRVVLALVVVPSRIGVDQYESMKKQIEETVGRVNGRFGTLGWTPVTYQYRYLPFTPLVGLYTASDICLVTPLRDGMNLIAKEYVASRPDGSGVLILSEMAGSVKELGEAIVINPNDRSELTEAIREALDMPLEEQQRRNFIMQERLRRYDVHRWAEDFLGELDAMRETQRRYYAKLLPRSVVDRMRMEYRAATARLLLLDYDGTLVPFARRPQQARPGSPLLTLLSQLAADPATTVVIVSGRERATLEAWFGSLPIGLVAEHGFWMRDPGEQWTRLHERASAWKQQIAPILQLYADRVPGSFVEAKEHSLVWHYRGADPDQARPVETELVDHIMTFTANIDVQVLRGAKVVEIRNAGVNKGAAARSWAARGPFPFILGVGDDWTDEDLFTGLPDIAYTVRVGITNTHARFNVRDHQDVLRILHALAG